ncbi:LuxR family transcriptional regulator [Mycobacterium paraterrae]|uniref:LuxR C-terminal-related transcriptional regulator n=1 Tax=Mycobacterium paraterrae TaxID=577492 RepID=A0ABY3VIT8_9MYCO|nr:LuxR family transcriptional regulator [Mycobacterium paraterrae]UMB69329.1 LuxR C-terminal-related transcriptional regulator [Mycobacterium paraterrae]
MLEKVLGGPVCGTCSERMWDLTRGNVLFLRHLVTQESHAGRLVSRNGRWRWEGTMQVSPSLADLVDSRIGEAPEPVLQVLDLVAVSEPLELPLLTSLADPSAIEDAERRGLIAVSHGPPSSVARLGHPLYGEVRQTHAGRARLERLRGRVARAMSAAAGSPGAPDPVRLALLWLQSDLAPDRELFAQAAQTAFNGLDMALAERFAAAAAAAGAGVDSELLRANTLTLLSRGREAEELLRSMSERALPEPTWSTVVTLRSVNLLWQLGQLEKSRTVIDDAIAGATELAAQRLLAFRAVQLAVEARPDDALRVCESVERANLGALPTLVMTWAYIITLGDLGRPRSAAAVAAETTPLAASSPGTAYYQAVILVSYLTEAFVLGGCLADALDLSNRTFRHCVDAAGRTQSFAVAVRGRTALAYGDLRTAVDCLRSAVADFADDDDGAAYTFGIDYAEALARAGDVEAGSEALAEMRRRHHPAHTYREADSLVASAWLLSARGYTSQARDLALQAADLAQARGQHAREVLSLQAAIQFGEQRVAARLARLAEVMDAPRAAVVARWAAAVGDHCGDVLLTVSRDLEAMGDRIAAADAAAHAALAYRREQRIGPGLTASGRAERLISECGATTPATRSARISLPLTEREREIAVLISQGLSNNEIAEALTLSVRTIEGHIYRACTRVEAAGRTQLAEMLAEFTPGRQPIPARNLQQH